MQASQTASRREPALNVPVPVLIWVGLLVAFHAGRALLPANTDMRLLLEMAFVPAPWSIALGFANAGEIVAAAQQAADTPQGAVRLLLAQIYAQDPPRPWSLVTYSLLHVSWAHLGVNCLLFVVFGSSVVRRAGSPASLALWLAAAIGGAVAQGLSDPRSVDLVIGASASASGFIAAAATFVFSRPGDGRFAFLRRRGALALLGLWFAANLLNGLILVPLGWGDADLAWPAHVGGLLVGAILFPLLAPRNEVRP